MTLDEEIAWWWKQAFRSETDAALIAFGVAMGLKLAKADYGARNNDTLLVPDRTTVALRGGSTSD